VLLTVLALPPVITGRLWDGRAFQQCLQLVTCFAQLCGNIQQPIREPQYADVGKNHVGF
jgi:hypothetical protein